MKYAYIHIPKTGGHSVKKMIRQNPDCGIQIFDHAIIFKKIPEELEQIVVIRNPIDRFTSAFFYNKAKSHLTGETEIEDPEHFVQELMLFKPEALKILKPHNHCHHVNDQEIFTDWVFHPQVKWIHNPTHVILLEDIDRGFKNIGIEYKIPHECKSEKIDFKYSKKSLDYISALYAEDIEYYNKHRNKS